jgi:hypothetical protein
MQRRAPSPPSITGDQLRLLRRVFDAVDKHRLGYVYVSELTAYLHAAPAHIYALLPPTFLACARRVAAPIKSEKQQATAPDGRLTFERCIAAVRLALGEHVNTTINDSPTPMTVVQQRHNEQPVYAARAQRYMGAHSDSALTAHARPVNAVNGSYANYDQLLAARRGAHTPTTVRVYEPRAPAPPPTRVPQPPPPPAHHRAVKNTSDDYDYAPFVRSTQQGQRRVVVKSNMTQQSMRFVCGGNLIITFTFRACHT